MASKNLTHWEVDPFFSAAEEVQNSADRMESAFRNWKHWKQSPDLSSNGYVEACRRDLAITVDTVKWQVEEFERAVQSQISKEGKYVNSASSRHYQFVKAIRQHVSFVERELRATEAGYKLQALNADSKVKANDCLAEFLSGSRLTGYNFVNDSQLAITETKEQGYTGPANSVRPFGCLEIGDVSHATPPTTSMLRAKNLIEYGHVTGRENHKTFDGCQYGEEMFAQARKNGLPSDARCDCEACVHSDTFPRNETSINTHDPVIDLQSPESFGNGLGFWGLWKGKKVSASLQLSGSGFKRWKDGDANLTDEFEDATSPSMVQLQKNICINDLEQGYNSRPGNHRKSCSSVASKVDCFEIKNSITGWESLQLPTRMQQSCSYGNIFHLTSGLIVAMAFVSLYFWFLSTIVPTEINAVVPGHFPN